MYSYVDDVVFVSGFVGNVVVWPCDGLSVKSLQPVQVAPLGSDDGTLLAALGGRISSYICMFGITVPFA